MNVRFIGHNTFLFETARGIRFMTDPWFAEVGLFRAVAPAARAGEIGPIACLLSSHNHIDHCDGAGLRLARECGATVIGSRRVALRALRAGCRAAGLLPGEVVDAHGLRITALSADHPCSGIFGDWHPIGFLIEADGMRIYFSGDTRIHPLLLSQLRAAGPMDLAFLQISCGWYFGDDGMRIAAAARLAREIRPAITVPMHYHGRGRRADPHDLSRALAADGLRTKVFGLGETHDFATGGPAARSSLGPREG